MQYQHNEENIKFSYMETQKEYSGIRRMSGNPDINITTSALPKIFLESLKSMSPIEPQYKSM